MKQFSRLKTSPLHINRIVALAMAFSLASNDTFFNVPKELSYIYI